MDLNNRIIILGMEIEDLYEIFIHEISKKIEEGKNKKILELAKHGDKIKFDFENIIKQRYTRKTFVKVKNGKECGEDIKKIVIENKQFLEKDFEDEIFSRKRLMTSWIIENMAVEKIGDIRGAKNE